MVRTFRCKHCGKTAPLNRRFKGKQKYCCKKECQQARIRNWKRQQYADNPDYRERSKESQKAWRQRHLADQYQKQYRDNHPEYVNRNRNLQKTRNEKRITTLVSTIIKPSSLILQFKDNGAYFLSRVKKDMIVSRDALSLQTVDT